MTKQIKDKKDTYVDYIVTNNSIDNKDKLMTNEGIQKNAYTLNTTEMLFY
jgi:hypothetical protein